MQNITACLVDECLEPKRKFESVARYTKKAKVEASAEYRSFKKETLEVPQWNASFIQDEVRTYFLPVREVFEKGCEEYSSISMNPQIMAGAPCFVGTRIPIYAVLEIVATQGTLESALAGYPKLSLQQIKEAIGFAKYVVECPVEYETQTSI